MPGRAPETEPVERVAQEEDFWDVVLYDEDWLRAEFDAVVNSIGDPLPPAPVPLHAWPRPERNPRTDAPAAPLADRTNRARDQVARGRGPPRGQPRQPS